MAPGLKSPLAPNKRRETRMALPDDYEKLALLTRTMLDAARIQNWDELTAIGSARDRIVAALPEKLPPMSPNDSARIAKSIKDILAYHAEISDRAGPWLEHTARLLTAFERADNIPAPSPQADT